MDNTGKSDRKSREIFFFIASITVLDQYEGWNKLLAFTALFVPFYIFKLIIRSKLGVTTEQLPN